MAAVDIDQNSSQAASGPQNDLNKFIEQWWQAQHQYNTDYASLLIELQNMVAEAKSGHIERAMQIAEMSVMPSAMTVQGSQIGRLATGMNIGSAFQEFTTAAQNQINGGANMTPEQAEKFVEFLQQFFKDINDGRAPHPWMSNDTRNQLNDAITKICKLFGVDNPSELNKWTVYSDIRFWSSNPTSTNPNGETGQQNLQDLQSGFMQWNNTESAQSQGLQAQTQFASNTFNQYLNACLDIFKAMQGQIGAMVRNQKPQ